MKKINLIILVLLFLSAGGFINNHNRKSEIKNVIPFVLYDRLQDTYPPGLFEYFAGHKIKTISFVDEDIKTNKSDSLTYLELDRSGRITKRTTKECTTIGCLPYMNRHVYHYSNGKIKRIDVYVFKKNSQPVLAKWLTADTSALDKFDWNTYTYNADTTFVETGIADYKFVKNSKGEVVVRNMLIKSSKQTLSSNFNYTDSTIFCETKFNWPEGVMTEQYKYHDDRVELWVNTDGTSKLASAWIIDPNGLISEIDNYRDGKVVSKIHLSYTFYG